MNLAEVELEVGAAEAPPQSGVLVLDGGFRPSLSGDSLWPGWQVGVRQTLRAA